jgi:hypothetical protein
MLDILNLEEEPAWKWEGNLLKWAYFQNRSCAHRSNPQPQLDNAQAEACGGIWIHIVEGAVCTGKNRLLSRMSDVLGCWLTGSNILSCAKDNAMISLWQQTWQ